MNFVFWQNIISPHQAPFLRALAHAGPEVTVVAPVAMTGDRVAMGWQVPDLGKANVVLAPTGVMVRELAQRAGALNVMAGARWTPLGDSARKWCVEAGGRMAVLSEAPDTRGVAGMARRFKYSWERLRWGGHYDFILAMGRIGVEWFCRCMYPEDKVFPFAYVTGEPPESQGHRGTARVVLYVGRLVNLKGVDVLLKAFAGAAPPDARLRLVGSGPEERRLRHLAGELGIASQVDWLGGRPAGEIPVLMAAADLLVLPSHKDGWGAVVNEALSAGLPVVCSSACGAGELLQDRLHGEVFRAGEVSQLREILKRRLENDRLPSADRARIREWARCIGGESMTRYFLEITRHIYQGAHRPTAPWKRDAGRRHISLEA